MEADNGHSEGGVVQIVEDTGVGARIILNTGNVHVRHDSQDSHDPGNDQVDAGIAQAEDPLVLEAVADVAVAVDGDGRDVEDGADYTQSRDEPDELALELTQIPVSNRHGIQHHRVRVDGHQHVCHREAGHEEVAWKTSEEEKEGERQKSVVNVWKVTSQKGKDQLDG